MLHASRSLSFLATALVFLPSILAYPQHVARAVPHNAAYVWGNGTVYLQTIPAMPRTIEITPLNLNEILEMNVRVTEVILAGAHLKGGDKVPPHLHYWDDEPLNEGVVCPWWYFLQDEYPNWSRYPPVDIWGQLRGLQKAGIRVLMSLGGADDDSWGLLHQDFEKFYPPLRDALKKHGVDGLDADININSTVTTQTVLKVLNRINQDFGPDFIITMAPTANDLIKSHDFPNPDVVNYLDIDAHRPFPRKTGGYLVDWYYARFWNLGTRKSHADAYKHVVSSGFAAHRVVMTLLMDPYYDEHGYRGLDGGQEDIGEKAAITYVDYVKELQAKFPNFGGVCGWMWNVAGLEELYVYRSMWFMKLEKALFVV